MAVDDKAGHASNHGRRRHRSSKEIPGSLDRDMSLVAGEKCPLFVAAPVRKPRKTSKNGALVNQQIRIHYFVIFIYSVYIYIICILYTHKYDVTYVDRQTWMDGWMDGWTDGWMDGWTDGRMDG